MNFKSQKNDKKLLVQPNAFHSEDELVVEDALIEPPVELLVELLIELLLKHV